MLIETDGERLQSIFATANCSDLAAIARASRPFDHRSVAA
jgi:hypothetical protein